MVDVNSDVDLARPSTPFVRPLSISHLFVFTASAALIFAFTRRELYEGNGAAPSDVVWQAWNFVSSIVDAVAVTAAVALLQAWKQDSSRRVFPCAGHWIVCIHLVRVLAHLPFRVRFFQVPSYFYFHLTLVAQVAVFGMCVVAAWRNRRLWRGLFVAEAVFLAVGILLMFVPQSAMLRNPIQASLLFTIVFWGSGLVSVLMLGLGTTEGIRERMDWIHWSGMGLLFFLIFENVILNFVYVALM